MLLNIYEHSEIEFVHYADKIGDFNRLFKFCELDEKLILRGHDDEYYYEWILSEIPDISNFDEWLITSRDSHGYWVNIRASDRLDSIKELWHKDKKTGGQYKYSRYSKGFFAINKSINMVIDVGSRLGRYDKGYNPEYYYTLSTLKI